MRLLRGSVPLVLDEYDYRFELGKAELLRSGAEVLVISSGLLTMRALEAAEQLAQDKVGEAVAGLLALPDDVLDAGALPTLHERYGISSGKVVESIRRWLA